MRYNPYPYQQAATAWIIEHPRCGLFLDMGLGKTVSTLTALRTLIDTCEVSTALVVAPKQVAETTWTAEAEKWDHLRGLRLVKVSGTPAQREKALSEKADIYILGRDNFVWLVEHYCGRLPFDAVVLDELTSFKSPNSLRFKAMRRASGSVERVIGLTGTPAPKGLIDLWAQLFCLDCGQRLGRSVTRYRETYFNLHRWNNIVISATLKPGAEEAIRSKISDICMSMQARHWLSLPPLLVRDVPVALSPAAMEGYKAFEREKVLSLTDTPITAASAAALMNKLSQYACGAVYDDEHNTQEIHSAKLEALAEIVEAAQGESVLVYYQYRHDIERIRRHLSSYCVKVYEGEEQLQQWNRGEIDVLLAHPASTAYGLNLQGGGHYIVWMSPGWDLELYQQANARLHRQGQQHPVTVFRLIASGTVDHRAASALDSKKATQQSLMDALTLLIDEHRNGKG